MSYLETTVFNCFILRSEFQRGEGGEGCLPVGIRLPLKGTPYLMQLGKFYCIFMGNFLRGNTCNVPLVPSTALTFTMNKQQPILGTN